MPSNTSAYGLDATREILDGITFMAQLADSGVPYEDAENTYPEYRGQLELIYTIKTISDEVGEYGVSLSGAPPNKVITRVREAAGFLDNRIKENGEPLCGELANAYVRVLQTAAGDRNTILGLYRKMNATSEPLDKDREVALGIVNATETILTKELRKQALISGKNVVSLTEYLISHPYRVNEKIFLSQQESKDTDLGRMHIS